MGKLHHTVTVHRAAADVARLLSDLGSYGRWMPNNWRSFEPMTRTTSGKGSRSTFLFNALGMWLPSEIEITEALPERVRWAMAAPPIDIRAAFHLKEENGATRVDLEAEWSARRLYPWRVRTLLRLRLRLDKDLEEILRLMASCLVQAVDQLAPSAPAPAPVEARADGLVGVARFDDLAPGAGRVVKAFGKDIALFRADDEVFAIDNDCCHRQGPLGQGTLDGHVVTCPLHRWRFDVKTGQSVSNPGAKVRAWPVRIDGGQVLIGQG